MRPVKKRSSLKIRIVFPILHLFLVLGIWKEGEGLPSGCQLSPTPADLDAHHKAIVEFIRIGQHCILQYRSRRHGEVMSGRHSLGMACKSLKTILFKLIYPPLSHSLFNITITLTLPTPFTTSNSTG